MLKSNHQYQTASTFQNPTNTLYLPKSKTAFKVGGKPSRSFATNRVKSCISEYSKTFTSEIDGSAMHEKFYRDAFVNSTTKSGNHSRLFFEPFQNLLGCIVRKFDIQKIEPTAKSGSLDFYLPSWHPIVAFVKAATQTVAFFYKTISKKNVVQQLELNRPFKTRQLVAISTFATCWIFHSKQFSRLKTHLSDQQTGCVK